MELESLITLGNHSEMDDWKNLAKAEMRKQRITQEQLAVRLGVSQGSVAHWLNGRREPNLKTISRVLTELGLPALDIGQIFREKHPTFAERLRKKADEVENLEIMAAAHETFRYPVISWVTAGLWAEAIEIVPDEYVATDYRGAGPCFWAKVKGDSMTSQFGTTFPEGTYVLVDTGLEALPGSFVVAKRETDNEATFKKLVEDAGHCYLKPLNPAYGLISVDGDTRFVGVVKEARQRL